MPMRMSKFSDLEGPIPLTEAKSILSSFYVVEASDYYDPLVGFIGSSLKNAGD